jgi:hypothetical protein
MEIWLITINARQTLRSCSTKNTTSGGGPGSSESHLQQPQYRFTTFCDRVGHGIRFVRTTEH